ncbi:MAG TPA: flagellar protein export ATPase FliI [Limnochordia bacterium]|nr:flagellar protein export ATPase FliI [Limnochordia bacterium]
MRTNEELTPRVAHYQRFLEGFEDTIHSGRVSQIVGLTIESLGPTTNIGDLCLIQPRTGQGVPAEVVGFRDQKVLLMPLAELTGVGPGSLVTATGSPLTVGVGEALLGRVLDGLGQPMDGKGYVPVKKQLSVQGQIPPPLERQRIKAPLSVGVKAIDGLLTCGKGQRIGVFAGSGVGKSTLLGMMARNTEADVNVIALIGERGREVREFLERDLGPEGMARSVVVVATSDQPALVRIKGALVATTIAEFFRDLGRDVLFVMDSVTRLALAQREVGLATGEPPATRGYTPSVFALLPKVLERTGPGRVGTITAFYTVLVEGDDMNEPITDAVRGILDGHIVLNRSIAEKNHYPAIDVLASVSRLMTEVASARHKDLAGKIRASIATYADAEDLINIGAYAPGSNPAIDRAIRLHPGITAFLQQEINDACLWPDTLAQLEEVFSNEQ